MAGAEPEAATSAMRAAEALRERWFLVVLVGLLVAIAGFTVAALQNSLYPCEPAAGSTAVPPLMDCAVALAPSGTVFVLGILLAAVGYAKVR